VLGTIQPRTLARVFRNEHRENGLLARLLFTMPPETVTRWTEADVSPEAYATWETVIESILHVLGGEAELTLAPDARRLFPVYHDRAAEVAAGEDDDLYAALAKLRGGALRFALVLALAKAAEHGQASDLREVDAQAMEGGIALALWFANEARRVYAALAETPEESEDRVVLDWIGSRGGEVTPHDLASSGPRRFRGSSEEAETRLRRLATNGRLFVVEHPPGSSGGRPATTFVLERPGAETPETGRENRDWASNPESSELAPHGEDSDLVVPDTCAGHPDDHFLELLGRHGWEPLEPSEDLDRGPGDGGSTP
jgi:hypothetical protein